MVGTNKNCGNTRCVRYEMTQMEFRRLRGELWDASFTSKFGKRAVKLFKDIYGKAPRLKRSRTAKRNPVNLFPCGVLEQVYDQMMAEGVPLIKGDSWVARQLSSGQRITPRDVRPDEMPLAPRKGRNVPRTYVPVMSE